jgi:hypothetical protein
LASIARVQPPQKVTVKPDTRSCLIETNSKSLRSIKQTDNADIGEIQRRIEDQYPLVEEIGIGPRETRFTGDIRKITVEVKEIE